MWVDGKSLNGDEVVVGLCAVDGRKIEGRRNR